MAAYNANGGSQSRSILSALAATNMLDTRSKLPAELLVAVLDYLPVADQMRVARTSRRMQEMVYEDARWVSRLRSMGCWDEREARQRFEEAVRRRREQAAAQAAAQKDANKQATTTLFDASTEEKLRKRAVSELRDGFETMTVGGPASGTSPEGQATYLDVFNNAKSIRGGARQEYGKIYGALAPFYFDIVKAKTHAEPIVFKAFRDPETQAQMLANLRKFAMSDWSSGCLAREAKLIYMMGIFEKAVVREFEQGYEFWDVDGRMRRFGHVLQALNGAKSAIDIFIQKHPILNDGGMNLNPIECINRGQGADDVSLTPSQQFFETLLLKVNEQTDVIERIFPDAEQVFWELVDKIHEDIIVEYTTPLFDEAHERSLAMYLKAVAGVFEQTMRFFRSLKPPGANEEKVGEMAKVMVLRVFEPHLDLYLQEELEYFTKQAEQSVSQWEKKLSEQDSSLESYYMSNINRSAEKKDFLSSFRKVIMMPVTALPGMGFSSGNSASASAAATPMPSRPETPSLGRSSPAPPGGVKAQAPTDELAAKAAIMASKLEGIKSLCSIEVALSLVQAAKTSLGRASLLIPLGGQVGGEAREQCSTIFVVLLRILGQRHVKHGFDLAVGHLSHYNPRDVGHNSSDGGEKTAAAAAGGVAPLVTFIELVNVGDLISQMIDVFYEQQLATPRIADRNDFLDPANMAKKKFEQMLDESVAAGLNKGIDVLMAEVEHLQATTQPPTDYNPLPVAPTEKTASVHLGGGGGGGLDIGPTATATRIVALVSGHTRMLAGTTDKSMLDVFNAEVGQRLFAAICKHLKRQRVSVDGAVKLIADMNLYSEHVRNALRIPELVPYFGALRELGQIYLIDAAHAKEMAAVIADGDRFGGVFRAEEVYEYAQRRADWYLVRKNVERAMYGMECCVM
ncbi:hypothetical protein ARSEF4850_000421 [Beauveria asiatica]